MKLSGLLGVVLLLAVRGSGTPETASKAKPIEYGTVSKEIVQRRLELYRGNDTKREAALMGLFGDAGCTRANLREQPVPGRKQPNVICVLPGSGSEVIVVGAHFDHVDAGDGVVDNWSGASLLPSLYQGIKDVPREHTYVFVGFTGEEEGLVGSDFYVKQLSNEQVAQIEVMINLDTLALGPTEVWVRQSDPALVGTLASVARAIKVPVTGMNVDGYGESDEESFIRRKVCAVMVHSLTPDTAHVLHHPDDNPHAIRFAEYYDTYRLMTAYLAVLDTTPVPQPHVCPAQPVDATGSGRSRFRMPRVTR